MNKTILVTGGGGFIGSHTVVRLIERGYDVVVVDNHSTSSPRSLDRVYELTGVRPVLYSIDIRDRQLLSEVFSAHEFDAVIHFAAKKAVGESTEKPREYFDINVGGTTSLLSVMRDNRVGRLVFSSSCSIYGNTEIVPLSEDAPPAPTNPYAWTKWTCEQMIEQACRYNGDLQAIALRYFNPIGAHPSGVLGEDPRGPVHNVMPYLMQVAVGRSRELTIFGSDYPTPDGTAIRDYIHVMDVADGHIDALDHLDDEAGMQVVNLGTGVGTSVLELRNAFAAASGTEIPFIVTERRLGDVPRLIADASKASESWGWSARYSVADMCRDSWNFQRRNPEGYDPTESQPMRQLRRRIDSRRTSLFRRSPAVRH